MGDSIEISNETFKQTIRGAELIRRMAKITRIKETIFGKRTEIESNEYV